jgi:hypothetical protein
MGKIIKGLLELVGAVVILIFIIRAVNDRTPEAKPAPAVTVTPHTLGEDFSVAIGPIAAMGTNGYLRLVRNCPTRHLW